MSREERSRFDAPASVLRLRLTIPSWRWRQIVQRVWLALACLLVADFLANLPSYYRAAQTPCTLADSENCPTGQLTPVFFHLLGQTHIPVVAAEVFFASLTIAVSLAYLAGGALIFWRRSHDWVGLLTSLLLVMMGSMATFAFPVAQTPALLVTTDTLVSLAIGLGAAVFFFTFPTGRFTPRWTLPLCAIFFVVSSPFVPTILLTLTVPLLLVVQVYRYLRVYDAIQRQQTKWFIFGFGLGGMLLLTYWLIQAGAPGLSAPDSWYQLLNPFMWLLLWTLLLVSLGIAVLRYRLWDIDLLINRVLVYGALTLTLTAVYVGLILGLQTLAHRFISNDSSVALVISTLLIAALFLPLRQRIQSL
ncbi:MAG: hypothetical protein ACRDID_05720, partial [Ktedonobacterales bacterium]